MAAGEVVMMICSLINRLIVVNRHFFKGLKLISVLFRNLFDAIILFMKFHYNFDLGLMQNEVVYASY